jgi:hypothetical protein
MPHKQKIKDLVETLKNQKDEVGLYLRWAEFYAMVPMEQALRILKRLSPNQEVSVTIVNGIYYLGYEGRI